MFGFLKPKCPSQSYRQVYAAFCSFQRRRYGVWSSVFTSYEAIFLYHLAIDIGACQPPASSTPTCCRFRNDWANNWRIDFEIADFCSAFGILLAQTKIEDDIRDSGSLVARGVNRLLRKKFDHMKQYFGIVAPNLLPEIQTQMMLHEQLEKRGEAYDMQIYSQPTARCFEFVFEEFDRLCSKRSGQNTGLGKIGESLGRAIIASDSLFDLEKDRRRGDFNPIRNERSARLGSRIRSGTIIQMWLGLQRRFPHEWHSK